MLQRTTQLEILREVVLPVETHHRLALHAVFRVRLQRHVNTGTSIDDALIQNGHLTGRIVDTIVRTLLQLHTTCRDLHRTLRHIVGTQRDDIGRRTLELAHQQVFVLVRHLTGSRSRGVVQLMEGIFLRHALVDAVAQQEVLQRRTERLRRREEHTAVADGVALHEVEDAVGVYLVVVVQTVTAQSTQQRHVLDLGDVR